MSFVCRHTRHVSAIHRGASRAVDSKRVALVSQRVVGALRSVVVSEASVSLFNRTQCNARSVRPRCASRCSSQRLSVVGVFIVNSSSCVGTASVSSPRMQVHCLRLTLSPNNRLVCDAFHRSGNFIRCPRAPQPER